MNKYNMLVGPLIFKVHVCIAHASSDPQDWCVAQSAQWIEWISNTLGLRDLSVSKLCIEGRVLCSLPQSELVRIVPSCGDVLFIVLKQISVIYKIHANDHCEYHC